MKKGHIIKEDGIWKLRFKNKKGKESSINISDSVLNKWLDKHIEESTEASVVEFKLNGQPTQIKYKDNNFNKNKYSKKPANSNRNRKNSTKPYARAPYNFVPLNDEVAIHAKADRYESFDKYQKDDLSGYIEVSIENLTPLFIRQISEDKNNFNIDGKYGIPGSSMRGMIRSLCEILSHGKFGIFDDKHLYFRSIFGNSALTNYYREELNIEYDRISKISTSHALYAGYLKEINGKEVIYKADNGNGRSKGYRRYEARPYNGFSINKYKDGIRFTSGEMDNAKYGYEFGPSTSEKYEVPKTVTHSYKNDVNRSDEIENFYKTIQKKHPNLGKPVFFALDEQKKEVRHYGHTMNYRLPYKHSVGDQIPEDIRENPNTTPDLVQALFGESFQDYSIASRLNFTDLLSDNAFCYDKPQLLKILSSPKPTTFQHYLEQDNDQSLKNWNDKEAEIRGFKLYWHRKTDHNKTEGNKTSGNDHYEFSWNEAWDESLDDKTDPETGKKYKTDSHSARVKPIMPKAKFTGKIWFQNLTEIELGLLLEALEPSIKYANEKSSVAHKIGLAKPLGLGSIEITVKSINCLDIKRMYEDKKAHFISAERKCAPQMVKGDKALKKTLKESFQTVLLDKFKDSPDSIWELDRLKELKEMMEYDPNTVDNTDWLRKTRYMEIKRKGKPKKDQNEFSQRPILKKPSEVRNTDESKFI